MAETYSLASTAYRAHSPFSVQPIQLPDSAGRAGAQAMAMTRGNQVLCKMPDGSLKYHTIDTERSRPGGPIYLLAV